MNVHRFRVIQRADLLEDLFWNVACVTFPVLVSLVKNVVNFKFVSKLLYLLPQNYVSFLPVCKEHDHFDILILHIQNLFDGLIARCNTATSGDKEDLFHCCPLPINNNNSFRLISESSERALDIYSVTYFKWLYPRGHFTSIWEIWVHVWSVDFKQYIHRLFLRTWGNWSVFSNQFLAFRMLDCWDGLIYSEMLTYSQLERFPYKFQFINVAVMI